MTRFLDCWIQVAADLFSQALAGGPSLVESAPAEPGTPVFGFSATVSGAERGQFLVAFDSDLLENPLLGEGMDQKAGWAELIRETFEAAAGELLARTGNACKVEQCVPFALDGPPTHALSLRSGDRSWQVLVRNELEIPASAVAQPAAPAAPMAAPADAASVPGLSPGLELLLDVELEASLRFGCREMPLGDLLDLGPGDVVQLDRHVSDPVDLIVGDKIVARGDVVLVNGNFGLRITDVAAPRKRLESIRCLF